MYPACSGLGKLESHGRGHLKCIQSIPTGHIGVTCCLYSQCIQHVSGGYLDPCPQCQQFDLTVLEEDILDIPITLGNHVVASGPRTLEERIESGQDWEQWLASVEDVEEEERLVAEAKETAKAWVDSLVGDVDIAPK